MVSRLTLTVVTAFAITLLMVGTGGAAKCTPHCSPDNSNQGAELKGLDRANAVAGDNGADGRANAAAKQGIVTTPPPVDTDGDTIPDALDACPNVYALTANGCPLPDPLPPPDPGPAPGS